MTLPDFLALLVVALASFRLTRIVTADSISDPFRAWVWRRAFHDLEPVYDSFHDRMVAPTAQERSRAWHWAYEGLSCSWCVGWWASLATYALWVNVAGSRPFVAAVAVAGVQGFLASREGA